MSISIDDYQRDLHAAYQRIGELEQLCKDYHTLLKSLHQVKIAPRNAYGTLLLSAETRYKALIEQEKSV